TRRSSDLAVCSAIVLVVAGSLFPAVPHGVKQPGAGRLKRGQLSPGHGYSGFYGATILVNMAMYVPFAHLPEAAQASGVAPRQSALLLGLLGAASVVSRLLIGVLGTRFDEWRLYRFCILCGAVGFVCWARAGSFGVGLLCARWGGFACGRVLGRRA